MYCTKTLKFRTKKNPSILMVLWINEQYFALETMYYEHQQKWTDIKALFHEYLPHPVWEELIALPDLREQESGRNTSCHYLAYYVSNVSDLKQANEMYNLAKEILLAKQEEFILLQISEERINNDFNVKQLNS